MYTFHGSGLSEQDISTLRKLLRNSTSNTTNLLSKLQRTWWNICGICQNKPAPCNLHKLLNFWLVRAAIAASSTIINNDQWMHRKSLRRYSPASPEAPKNYPLALQTSSSNKPICLQAVSDPQVEGEIQDVPNYTSFKSDWTFDDI